MERHSRFDVEHNGFANHGRHGKFDDYGREWWGRSWRNRSAVFSDRDARNLSGANRGRGFQPDTWHAILGDDKVVERLRSGNRNLGNSYGNSTTEHSIG